MSSTPRVQDFTTNLAAMALRDMLVLGVFMVGAGVGKRGILLEQVAIRVWKCYKLDVKKKQLLLNLPFLQILMRCKMLNFRLADCNTAF